MYDILFQTLIPLWSIVLALLILIYTGVELFKYAHKPKHKVRRVIDRWSKLIVVTILVSAVAWSIIILLFLSNPLEVKNAETVKRAEIDPNYTPPSQEEITKSNKLSEERRKTELKNEAVEGSNAAMEKAKELFTNH